MATKTLIQTSKLIKLSECNLETKSLLTGTLLKWMDIIACLAAEKHANVPCVTASVDDLQLTRNITLGQVITLKAWINRAFNTSMEVEVSVNSESMSNTEQDHICQAYFTFVTQPNELGEKQYVSPIEPVTERQKMQYHLANERKKMRLDYRASLQKMKEDDESFDERDISFEESNNSLGVDPESTFCEFVDIVLPQHANHHRTTFGGQLMAWMESTGTISARRLCKNHPRLVAVDEVFFRGPSKVGDRIVVKSCVNNTFQKSMEVGVRVEAYATGCPLRHIQSAYFSFISPGEHGNPLELPDIVPTTKENYCRKLRAEARYKMRQERRMILSSNRVSVALTKYNQNMLCYKNILALMELYNSPAFKLKAQVDTITLYDGEIGDSKIMRIESYLEVSTEVVYRVLTDHKRRSVWDNFVTDVSIEMVINKRKDSVLHYAMNNISPNEKVKGDDFVVLASSRKGDRDIYMIAFRSVIVDSIPPRPEYRRAENRCSGFVLEPHVNPSGKKGCKIVYVNQLTDHVQHYVKNDLSGESDWLARTTRMLKALITSSAQAR